MQKRLPKPFSLLLFFFLLSNYLSATPECPIISGKFQQVDGTISDASATGWYLDATHVASTGYFSVKSNRLHAQELGGEGIWYSRVFSTAGYSDFQVAVKVSSEGDMNSSEYVKIYYKINGGAETLLDSRTGNFGTIDFTSGTLTGSNVQLVVKIYNYNNGGSQTSKYYIEEYRVFKEKGPCAVSAINVTAAAANGGLLTCASPSLGLSATATGSGTTTWSWSGPGGYTSSLQNPAITTAGTYTVVATNSSGTGSASVTVTENKTAPVITATGGALACGSCVTISATSNVSGATYSWSGPSSFTSTSQNPTVCTAGTYTVTVTNPANGCSAQQSVTVSAGGASTFWLEDFTGLSNGITSDAGTTAWTTSVTGSGTYSVQNNEYKVSFSGSQGVGIWTSQAIDISSKSNVTFSVDLRSELASTSDAFETTDYIRVYYKLNGGAETLVYEDLAGIGSTTNTTGSVTVNSSTLNGSTLQVIIKTSNSDPTERYFFDNIKLTGSNAGSVTVTPSVNGTVTCTATAQLSATASGTISTWAWTGPNSFTSALQNPVVNAGGQYIVTATLSTGCTASATITVPENKTAPDITATGGTLACLSSITLNVNSTVNGATYRWTGPNSFSSTAKNPTVTAIGTYTATVTNPANGCTAQQSVSVTSGSSAAATFWLEDFTGLVDGTTSDAGATAWTSSASGSGIYSVQSNEFKTSFNDQYEGVWTSQAVNISGKSNVTISVDLRSEVTSGTLETSDYIRVYYKLNGGAETLVYEDLAGIGSTTTGTASTTITSAALNGSTLQVIIKTSNSGTAERYYFDNIKLTGSDISTEGATATAGGSITCTNSSVTLLGNATSGGVSYSWTGPNNFTATVQNPVVTATGIYTLTVHNPATGCNGTDTALVALNTTGPGASASASGSLSCNSSSSVTLSGSSSTSGVTYSWTGPNNFASTAQNPVVTTAGTYNLTVTNPANGCTSTASTTVTVSNTSTGTAWAEDFTLADGTTSDAGATSWSITTNPSTTLFSVLNNEIRISNSSTTGEGVWTSGAINITGKTNVGISAGVRSSIINGAVMNTDATYGDYIRFYYKLNNGTEVLFAEKTAGINSHSTTPTPVSVAGLSGTSLQIVVRARATGNDEFYYFDNVQVVATSQTSLTAMATATDILTCTRNSVALTGSSSATSGINYSWTGPNNFTSTVQNPLAPAAGIYTLTVTNPSTGCTGSDTALVSLNNTAPGASASASGAVTCNTGSSATLTGSSSTSGVTYSWTGANNFASTAQNPVVTAVGTYNLTVTNPINGCTSTAMATVTMSNTITATAWAEDFTLANGTTSDAGATSWSTTVSPSTALFSVLNNEFRVSNSSTTAGAEGVWTSGAIDITGKTNVGISAGVRSSIINGAVMNTDATYGDYIRFYYKLNNGTEVLFAEKTAGINNHSTTPTPVSVAGLSGTSLQIVVRARATGNDEFYYFDNVQVVATGNANVTANAVGGAMNCINSSVTLQGSTTASGASYTWGGPNGYTSSAQNPVVSATGTYTLTVALGSCTATASAIVSKDTIRPGISATANPIKLTCVATPATLTGSSSTSGVGYSWSNGIGVIATTAITSVTNPGTYILTVSNPVNGCSSTSQVIVTQDIEAPTGVTASHTGIITCNTPSIAINATVSSPGLNYSWSGPNGYSATTLNASATRGGTYIITATNPTNGCFATASTIVEENTAPPGEISINNSGIITCLNSSITISGHSSSSGVNYTWEGPNAYSSNSSSANVSHGGIYSLTAINPGNGCKSSKSTNVVENTTPPVFTIGNTSPLSCGHPTVTLSANTTTPNAEYQWIGPDIVDVTSSVTTSTAGFYFITVKDPANGCTATDFTEVTEDYSDCGARKSTTGAATNAAQQNTPAAVVTNFTYKAYPNPVTTTCVIEFASPQNTNTSVSLYNALGTCEKVLFKGTITANRLYQVAVPAMQLPAGAYYYIISTGGKSYTGKLMIVK